MCEYAPLLRFVVDLLLVQHAVIQQAVRQIHNKSKANSKSTTDSPQQVVEQTASLTTSWTTCRTASPQ